MKTAPAIAFEYRASRILLVATVAVALLALLAVSLSGCPHWLRLVLYVAIGALAGTALRQAWRPRIQSVAWRSGGDVELVLHHTPVDDQRNVPGGIRHARVMGPLIVLTFGWHGGLTHLWLLPDNLDADTRRRLRIRLGAEAAADFGSVNPDSG